MCEVVVNQPCSGVPKRFLQQFPRLEQVIIIWTGVEVPVDCQADNRNVSPLDSGCGEVAIVVSSKCFYFSFDGRAGMV